MSEANKLRLNSVEIRFGSQYDPVAMQQLMTHVSDITRLNQKFVQLLRGGSVGQVLRKTGPGDLEAEWVDP